MGYIPKDDVLARLDLIKEECLTSNRRACAGTAQDAIDTISRMKEYSLTPEKAEPETSAIITSLEPYFLGGQIGRDVHRCGFCQTQVDLHDRFCKFCGRKLIAK